MQKTMEKNMHIYIMQILFVGGISYGSQSLNLDNKHNWAFSIARYVLYILATRAMYGACVLVYNVALNRHALDAQLFKRVNKQHVVMFLGAIVFLVLNDQTLIDKSFFMILIASVVVKYLELEKKTKVSVNYGVGMACSYFEGYLIHVLPSDGAKFFGFQENIRVYEDRQGVVFPVKKLFIVVTKSLYGPPALQDFTRSNRDDVAKLEACSSLSEIEKDVAGVKNRIYKNTAYKIHRANRRPVCVSAQGGTPMHTLYLVLKNRDLSEQLSGIDREAIVADFLTSLRKIIAKSPECRDKCELIYFDDTDREQNLAEVLLDRIRELEPNFEEIIATPR